MKFVILINLKLLTNANYFLLNIVSMKISLLINMKMLTSVRIFILAEKFSCSAELSMKKSFINSDPEQIYLQTE